MRRLFGSGLIGLLLVVGTSAARAADHLGCVTAAIDMKLSEEIFAAYRANKDLGEALMARIGDKIAACAAANDWSVEALESAVRVAFGQVLTRGVLVDMKAYPVEPGDLQRSTDNFIAKLPVEKLRKFVDGDLPDEDAGLIVKQLVGDEVVRLSQIDEKLGHLIGEYAAGRANETFFTAEFARQ